VAGQAIDVTHVLNGSYRLKVEVNPEGKLYEGTDRNDVALRRLRLGGRPGHRRATVHAWRGIDG
jgi:Lysyl oxidase